MMANACNVADAISTPHTHTLHSIHFTYTHFIPKTSFLQAIHPLNTHPAASHRDLITPPSDPDHTSPTTAPTPTSPSPHPSQTPQPHLLSLTTVRKPLPLGPCTSLPPLRTAAAALRCAASLLGIWMYRVCMPEVWAGVRVEV